MTDVAMGHRSLVQFGEETTWGTEATRTRALSINSQAFPVDEGLFVSGAMRGDNLESVSARGNRGVTGNLATEPNANDAGFLARGLFASRTTAALPGTIALAPSQALVAGGDLTAGQDYRYKVSVTVQDDDTGDVHVLAASPEVTGSPSGGNKTVRLTWVNPTVPARQTLVGHTIWRGNAGGGANVQYFLAYQEGTGTTYDDTGANTVDTAITPPAQVYTHSYVRGTGRPASWSIEATKDNEAAELVTGMMANGLNISLQPDGQVQFDLDLIGKDLEDVDTPSETSVSVAAGPFMGNRVLVFYYNNAGTAAAVGLATQISLAIANNLNGRRWLNNSRLLADMKTGRHQVTGSFVREYEDQNVLTDVLDGTAKALKLIVFANGIATWTKEVTVGDEIVTLTPWPYQMHLNLPKVILTTHDAPSSGADPISQTCNVQALKDSGSGYTLQMVVHNLTDDYTPPVES